MIATFFRKYYHLMLVLLILLLSLWVRLQYVVGVDVIPAANDMADYDQRAMRLLEQGTFATGHVHGATYRPPGYIVFLAGLYKLFGHNLQAVYLVQTVLSVAMLYGIYLVGKRLFADRNVAFIALVLAALYLPFIGYSGVLLTEVLFLTLFLYAISAFLYGVEVERTRWFVVSGVLFGLATLTRSVALLVPVLLVVWLLFYKKSIRLDKKVWLHVALVFVMMFLTISPWTIRNAVEQKQFVLVDTISGLNLLLGNNDYAKGFYTNEINQVPGYQYAFNVGKTDAERDKIMQTAATHWISDHKEQFFNLTLKRLQLYLAAKHDWVGALYHWERIGIGDAFAYSYQYWLTALAIVGGVAALFFERKALLLLLLAGYFICGMSVFYVQTRYRLPAMPFFILLNAYLLWQMKRKWLLIAPAVIGAYLLVLWLQGLCEAYNLNQVNL